MAGTALSHTLPLGKRRVPRFLTENLEDRRANIATRYSPFTQQRGCADLLMLRAWVGQLASDHPHKLKCHHQREKGRGRMNEKQGNT